MVWLGFAVGTEASEVKGWTRPLFSLKSESPGPDSDSTSHMLFHCEQSDLCLSFLPRKTGLITVPVSRSCIRNLSLDLGLSFL